MPRPALDIDAKELTAAQRNNLVSLLSRASGTFESDVLAEVKAHGLGRIKNAHLRLLLNLDLGGNRISVLAERSGLSRQTVGSHVHELAKLGTVRLEPDPTDGRARIVVLTKEGLKNLMSLLEIIRSVTRRYGETVGRRRITQLHSTLSMLLDAIMGTDGKSV